MEKRGLLTALKRVAVVRSEWLLYVDEMRIGLWGQTRRVWSLCGIPVIQKVQIARKMEGYYVDGPFWDDLEVAVKLVLNETGRTPTE